MTQSCINITIPDPSDILKHLIENFIPLKQIEMLIGYVDGLFDGLSSDELKRPVLSFSLVPMLALKIIKLIADPIIAVVGGAIDEILPEFLGVISFSEILSFDIKAILQRISDAGLNIATGVIQGFVSPVNKFFDVVVSIALYVSDCIYKIETIIKRYTQIVSGATLTFPDLPKSPRTVDDLVDLFNTLLDDQIESLFDAAKSIVNGIEFLGYNLLSFDGNTLGNLTCSFVDNANKLLFATTSAMLAPIKILVDLIESILGDFLTIAIPKICFEVE